MDTNLLLRVIMGKKITKQDIYDELYEMCDREHSHCSSGNCLVRELNNGEAPDTADDFEVNRGCDCFKNGANMYDFIKLKLKKNKEDK